MTMKTEYYRTLVITVVLFLFMTGYLSAQSEQELPFGISLYVNLDTGEEHIFSIRPDESGIVIVETSGNIDTYLQAYDAADTLLYEDDDGGENFNARVQIYVEAGKTYRFVLSGYDDNIIGSCRIWAVFEPIAPDTEMNTESSRATPLRLGEAFPLFFRTPDESRWFSYQISQPGTLFVVQTRGNLDTILLLYDDQGNLIGSDDDSGENYNALIAERLNPGTIYIEIIEYSGQIGRCTIHAETR